MGRMLGPMRIVLGFVVVIAIASATLNVFGPRVLGHGTDIIVNGVTIRDGINFGDLHHAALTRRSASAASRRSCRSSRRTSSPVSSSG